jgi:hypothetical protein
MSVYSYKSQVHIIVALMALHNYIKRRSHDDVAFAEFDLNLNFIPNDFLADVACSENHDY